MHGHQIVETILVSNIFQSKLKYIYIQLRSRKSKKILSLAIHMKVIKDTKYLDIHYFQIPGQNAPDKILNLHNSLLQVTLIQVYNNKSISNKKTQSYKLLDSIKKFRGAKPGLCFCPSAVRNKCQ